jgi:tetratricopeptide (TPR) repeat protein
VATAVLVVTRWPRPTALPSTHPARILPPSVAPASHADALARIDRDLTTARVETTKRADDWLAQERLATLLMAHARLTGSYDDYAEAAAALDRGFAAAGPRAGPHLAAAALAMLTHRLDAAERMLSEIDRYAMPAEPEIRSEAEAMRGDIAMYRGRYAEAARRYAAAETLAPGAGLFARRALLEAHMGRPDDALLTLDHAERSGNFTTPQAAAGLKLQRGTLLLQIGRWEDADLAFAEADALFPGHWQIEQNRAQMAALAGDTAGAIRRYQLTVARAGNPETMDALAALYRAQGDYPRAQALIARAAPIWEARLRTVPEAAHAHALDHYLAFGPAQRALDIAWAGFRARPHGASAVALGWALLANDRAVDALRMAQAVTRSGWVSAEQHMLAAEALAMLGRGDEAEAERKQATAINPRILDRRAALIWFGH